MGRAVSKAMEALSREIILDTYRAMRGNGETGTKASSHRGLSAR